jgi:hypothetical protein
MQSFLGLIGPAWTVSAAPGVCKYSGCARHQAGSRGTQAGERRMARARREKISPRPFSHVCLIFSGAHPENFVHTRHGMAWHGTAASILSISIRPRLCYLCVLFDNFAAAEVSQRFIFYFEARRHIRMLEI